MNELHIVEWLQSRVPVKAKGVVLGIGDDCAIFRPSANEDLLLKTDPSIEGVHFLTDLPAHIVGQRALARNLSDIAAMGGKPRVCLVSLTVGPHHDEAWVKSFFKGLLKLAAETGTQLIGGDLSHSKHETHVDVTLCGAVPKGKALRRDGARPGDLLYVSGRLGKAWDRPIQPRLALGQRLLGRATACMDLSDGIALDLHRLCLASGVSARVERVPIARGSTLERALHGGEDYELLFTLPPETKAPAGTTRIGEITLGKPLGNTLGNPGAVLYQGQPLPPRGYDHFGIAIK
ncbi:MAG: thiamine-phosphate kinase [Acidobacteriota bacterium]